MQAREGNDDDDDDDDDDDEEEEEEEEEEEKLEDDTHLIGDVVHYNSSLSPTIVHGSEAVIPLLASSVPYFKFDGCIIKINSLSEKGS